MRIQIYPDGVITIDTDPPNDAEHERDTMLDAMTDWIRARADVMEADRGRPCD